MYVPGQYITASMSGKLGDLRPATPRRSGHYVVAGKVISFLINITVSGFGKRSRAKPPPLECPGSRWPLRCTPQRLRRLLPY